MPTTTPDVESELGRGYVYEITPGQYSRYSATSFWPYVVMADGAKGYLLEVSTERAALAALRLHLGLPVEAMA